MVLPGQLSLFPMMMDAEFSSDRKYRYSLTRRWDLDKPTVNFIMLNPSTADYTTDDNTVRRCVAFCRSWGYGGLVVTNLFAWRATDPRRLKDTHDPVGSENDQYLLKYINECERVICAWGNHGDYLGRGQQVVNLLRNQQPLWHLGLTKSGQPKHPLYLNSQLFPEFWIYKV